MVFLRGIRRCCGYSKDYKFLLRSFSSVEIKEYRPSYIHNPGKEKHMYRTLGQQLGISAEKYKDREAVVFCESKQRFTFSQIKYEADRLAAGFLKIGLEKGDRIGIWAPNMPSWYLTKMAAGRAGLILVAINPSYQVSELEYCLNKVKVKAVVAPDAYRHQKFYDILTAILPELYNSKPGNLESKRVPSLKSVIIDSNLKFRGTFNFNELLDEPSENEINTIEKIQSEIDPDSCCGIQFTSGTTGHPKAAKLSHFNYVNNSFHIGVRNELNLKYHRTCMQVPFFHAFGIVIATLPGVHHGSTLVVPSSTFNTEASLKSIVDEKCTVIYGTPTMYVDLIRKQKELNFPLETAEIAVTGGAPCSPFLFSSIKKTLGLKRVKTVFGMTETTAVIFQSLPIQEADDLVLETVGHIQEDIEAKLIDENGAIVPMGSPGELCIRSYANMLGYWDDEKKTKEIISDDKWMKTGDQFVFLENNYGKIVGRLKDMIIRGGENLFPKEIEDFLNTHPDVLEAHVIGVPDERLGEEVCAYVRLKEGTNMTLEDMKLYCKGKIAHFKVPKYFVVSDVLPKTTSGKIQKFKLLKEFKESFQK